jgi:LacI family transcriptional regulator
LAAKDKPPSLAAVAASAGVSVATVSKVVNGRADVGAETRARIQTLLEEHQYVARRTDSARTAEETQTVELVFHGEATSYTLEILRGVAEAATEAGVTLAITIRARQRRGGNGQPSAEWVRSLARRGRTAVLDVVDDVRHGDLSALSRSRLPVVVLDPASLPRREVTSVGATNFSGGFSATQHLLGLGHARIGYLGAAPEIGFNQARMHGYRAALEAAGVTVPEGYVLSGEYDYDAGVAGGGALLDLPVRPTAIFAVTDESAAGVIEAARSRKLRVPEDLSIVGFDDTPLARLLSPPLTTVRQPLREMGQVALRTALRLAAGERLESHHVELATELVVRSSTAPPSDHDRRP